MGSLVLQPLCPQLSELLKIYRDSYYLESIS